MNEQPQNKQINIELTDDVAQGIYSNLAIITHSSSEFIIDFARVLPGIPKAGVKTRVILTPEHAKEILSQLVFYPGMRCGYHASICGRACDTECYIHLEEKGVLTRKFLTPFRKRPKWSLS